MTFQPLFNMIAFDADDTLWHSEIYYREAENRMVDLVAAYGIERQTVLEFLHRIEIDNLKFFGYGIKGFTLSMIDAAIEATGGEIRSKDIQTIVRLGREMTRHNVHLLDHSAEIVARLAEKYPLMIITKGDLMDQQRKIEESGLSNWFQAVEIVSTKTTETYETLIRKYHLAPEQFLMIGNAMRSDILPVLDVGGWAVHVPYHNSWTHEAADAPEHKRFFAIEHLGQLPALIANIEAGI